VSKRQQKWLRKGTWGQLVAGLLSLWVLGWAIAQVPARANEIDQLRQQQQQVDQQRSAIQQERDRLQQAEGTAKQQLGQLQLDLNTTNLQLKDSDYRLKLAQKQLQELQEDYLIAEKAYRQKQAATIGRLRFLQRQQGGNGWAVLLQSRDLSEFLARREQLKRVYAADRQGLEDFQAETVKIRQQRQALEEQRNNVALLTQQLLAQKSEVQAKAQVQTLLVDRLTSDRAALEAAETQLARDSSRLRGLIQQRVAAAAPKAIIRKPVIIRGSGLMVYPSAGEITSNFGWRVHPILGTDRFHAGIDFGVDYGSPIQAAADGVVIIAEWYGGYGNTVVIDHGNGITSLYGHASELYVREGQVVKAGEAIAAVGSTGFSTGPHLHFEVREEGEPVDPFNYLG